MTSSDMITWFIIYASTGIVSILFAAWIFSLLFQVKKKIKIMEVQTKIMYLTAIQAGVDKVELKNIVHEVIAVY